VLTLFLHPFQAAANRVDTRCETPLEHRHRETYCPASRAIVAGSTNGLVVYIGSELVIEFVLIGVDGELARFHDAFSEERLHLPGFGIGKRNECLLNSPQIERGILSCHCLVEALHIAIDILV
jgi:hypothetical protein